MKMTVTLEWNDELGPRWMNVDNLRSLLYGQTYVKPELLEIDEENIQFFSENDLTEHPASV